MLGLDLLKKARSEEGVQAVDKPAPSMKLEMIARSFGLTPEVLAQYAAPLLAKLQAQIDHFNGRLNDLQNQNNLLVKMLEGIAEDTIATRVKIDILFETATLDIGRSPSTESTETAKENKPYDDLQPESADTGSVATDSGKPTGRHFDTDPSFIGKGTA